MIVPLPADVNRAAIRDDHTTPSEGAQRRSHMKATLKEGAVNPPRLPQRLDLQSAELYKNPSTILKQNSQQANVMGSQQLRGITTQGTTLGLPNDRSTEQGRIGASTAEHGSIVDQQQV